MKKRKKKIRSYGFIVVSEAQAPLFYKMQKLDRMRKSVNGLISALLIGAFFALIVFSVFTNRCPAPGQVMDAWERLRGIMKAGR